MPKLSQAWQKNLVAFRKAMTNKILKNLPKKGQSWREMDSERLRDLMQRYAERSDWVSVANISFFLWENENIPARKIPALEDMGLFKEDC